MDTAWIQIFVLTLTECVAPAGKSVCQEREFELQFLTQPECEFALEQLVTLKDASDSVIVEKSKSSCAPSARKQSIYASPAEVADAVEDKQGWRDPDITEPPPESMRKVHEARLEALETCEKKKGVAPCKIGEIIIEDVTHQEPVDVWRRDRQ